MDKTIGYWIETLSGYISAVIIMYFSFENWEKLEFIKSADFLDKIISITTTLFGFLLAVLTLIIQSNSSTITKMKSHGSFKRLILLNKLTVLTSIINCIYSLILAFTIKLIEIKSLTLLKIATTINIGIFSFVIVNTFLFTIIFYKIILEDEKDDSH
ncbi:hypothetical protein [Flavobacterium pectinovorum]|uniref:hypothetical protein n=1 Tax=Flavobacterium pectinovorum TaxID=29533 RepID=UPI001FAB6F3F|nr:hypothetical protein [Flavobacterium pectinovorum]MCI9844559.1 hypothetical protein [Flavobacterium pectinovorum]